jgi:hypothetical protein
VHAAAVVLPTAENCPAPQLMQSATPMAATAEYLPTTQFVHAASAVLPTAENFPAPQLMQSATSMAATAEYLPITQSMQSASAQLPAAENLPAPQLMQSTEAVAAVYLPTSLCTLQYLWQQHTGPRCNRYTLMHLRQKIVPSSRPCMPSLQQYQQIGQHRSSHKPLWHLSPHQPGQLCTAGMRPAPA